MMRFTVTHEINCDAATFWKLFLDREFNEKLYRDALHFSHWSILEQTEDDKGARRKCTGAPRMNMPGPVQKLLGSSFSYTETGTLDKATGVWRWQLIPSVMPDKVNQSGTLRIEPVGTGKIRRIAELVMDAKVFGLGGMIESASEKQLRDGWNDSAVFMNKYLAEHHPPVA